MTRCCNAVGIRLGLSKTVSCWGGFRGHATTGIRWTRCASAAITSASDRDRSIEGRSTDQLSRGCLVGRPNNVAHGRPLSRPSRALLHFHSELRLPLDNKVRANQFPRSVSPAEPFRCFVVTVSIPSRARSAVVIPDIGLPPSAPCQAPSFLLSPPALKQVTNALFLLGDSSAIGACRFPGARTVAEEEQIVSPREAGSTERPLRLVMSAPLDKSSGGRVGDNNQAGASGVSCKNARSTEKESHPQVINSCERFPESGRMSELSPHALKTDIRGRLPTNSNYGVHALL